MAKKAAATKAAPKPPTKAEIYKHISETVDMPRKDVVEVLDALDDLMIKSLKKSGEFNLLGLGKMTLIKKPAVKAKKGEMTRNPFTGEETPKKDRPASKTVKFRPLKALKDKLG